MKLTVNEALQRGMAAHKGGKLQDAERLYRAILQSQPTHPDANHNLGVLAVSGNKSDAALPLFKTALTANPKKEQFWFSYIDALIKEQKLEAAKQVIEQVKSKGMAAGKLASFESQLIATNQAGESQSVQKKKNPTFATKREKIAEAKKNKRKKTKSNAGNSPSNAEINELLLAYQNKKFNKAQKLALSLTKRFPKHPFSWKILSALFRQSGKHSEAVKASQTAALLSPQDAEAHNNLGITLKELGRLDEAQASYAQAIALRFEYAEAHYNLGNTFKELGRFKDAEVSYNQTIALQPDFVQAHYNLGKTLEELCRLDEAEASYKQAIALKSDYVEAHSNLGNTLKGLGRLDEAESSQRTALALKPEFAVAHFNLGKVQYATGDKDAALSSVKRANAIDPKSDEFRLLLCVLKARQAREHAKVSIEEKISSDSALIPHSKIILLKMPVKQELIDFLYSTRLLELDKEKDPSFGNTKGSKYNLFKNSHPMMQKLSSDLSNMLIKEFNSDIFIYDSFLSIFGSGGGTTRHTHVNKLDNDETFNLVKQKYALVYYLSIGDQTCDKPGVLKFYEPDEEILPSKGLVTIFPADRYHSSVYGGATDRVIVGVNFYLL